MRQVADRIAASAAGDPPSQASEHGKIIRSGRAYCGPRNPYLDYRRALGRTGWPIATGVIEGHAGHLVHDAGAITGRTLGPARRTALVPRVIEAFPCCFRVLLVGGCSATNYVTKYFLTARRHFAWRRADLCGFAAENIIKLLPPAQSSRDSAAPRARPGQSSYIRARSRRTKRDRAIGNMVRVLARSLPVSGPVLGGWDRAVSWRSRYYLFIFRIEAGRYFDSLSIRRVKLGQKKNTRN